MGIQKRGRWDCPKHLTIPYSDLKNNLNPTNQLQYPRLLTLRTNHTNTKITIYEATRFNFTLNSISKWSKTLPLLITKDQKNHINNKICKKIYHSIPKKKHCIA